MFIVWEGIDGSGKTTLSNRVAKALRAEGITVEHVREEGKFASSVTHAIRELGRDARNLAMTPHTELLLYAARDAQLIEEATRPALSRADVVFADRFLYSTEVLAKYGRGTPPADVDPVVAGAARGLVPDLVILVDVDPDIARARRRVSKIVGREVKPPSRKGLSGTGLQQRLRAGYRALAAADPGRWIVIDNTEAALDEQTALLIDVVRAAVRGGPAAAIARAGGVGGETRTPTSLAGGSAPVGDISRATEMFLGFIDRAAAREPALAAYFLSGLCGPEIDARREALAATAPEVIAAGLRYMIDPASVRLRRALVSSAPRGVARSLVGLAGDGDEAARLRRALLPHAPAEVAESLARRDDDESWRLRDELRRADPASLILSVTGVGGPRAWQVRDEWLAVHGGSDGALAAWQTASLLVESVEDLDDERAWTLREAARAQAPVEALGSLGASNDQRAWQWRQRDLRLATKTVMKTIVASGDARAHALREAVADRCKEAVDSLGGLDDERAWTLRDAHAGVWPATTVKSLGRLATSARGDALVRRVLAVAAPSPTLLKHCTAIGLGVFDQRGWET